MCDVNRKSPHIQIPMSDGVLDAYLPIEKLLTTFLIDACVFSVPSIHGRDPAKALGYTVPGPQ